MAQPHVHADIIKAWADGEKIQAKLPTGVWNDVDAPVWHPLTEYRVKPNVMYVHVFKSVNGKFDSYVTQNQKAENYSTAWEHLTTFTFEN